MTNIQYPSKSFIKFIDFTVYIHQKYCFSNDNLDSICQICSKRMTLKIARSGKNIFWQCPRCYIFKAFYLDYSKLKNSQFPTRQDFISSKQVSNKRIQYGFCSCHYDRSDTILDRTPPDLLRKFISIFYWLVNIDENLYSEINEYDSIPIRREDFYGNLYDYTQKIYMFPKFMAHGLQRCHADPIFLFHDRRKYMDKSFSSLLPSERELAEEKNLLWGEVRDFLIHSGVDLFRVKSLITRMEECLSNDYINAVQMMKKY